MLKENTVEYPGVLPRLYNPPPPLPFILLFHNLTRINQMNRCECAGPETIHTICRWLILPKQFEPRNSRGKFRLASVLLEGSLLGLGRNYTQSDQRSNCVSTLSPRLRQQPMGRHIGWLALVTRFGLLGMDSSNPCHQAFV